MPEITETEETLRDFCNSQVKRLSIFRAFGFVEPIGVKEIRKWLERKGENRPAITALIDSAVLLEELPTLADLGRLWNDQHPPQATALPDCPHCSGSGFEIIRRGDTEGAKRCRCGGVPVADPNAVFVGQKAVA